jgi:hypothetical protein
VHLIIRKVHLVVTKAAWNQLHSLFIGNDITQTPLI